MNNSPNVSRKARRQRFIFGINVENHLRHIRHEVLPITSGPENTHKPRILEQPGTNRNIQPLRQIVDPDVFGVWEPHGLRH